MKKSKLLIISLILTSILSFGLTGCSETGGQGAMATAIGVGHGSCITEVTVLVDGAGKPVKVQFDDIFPIADAGRSRTDQSSAGLTTTGKDSRGGEAYFYNALFIDDEEYELVLENDGKLKTYKSTKADGGTTQDLVEYTKTEAGAEYYYNNIINKKAFYGAKSGDGYVKGSSRFTTLNGSMRKRYSVYWSSTPSSSISSSDLGFSGNMDALENYLLIYGFDGVDNNGNIISPSKDNGKNYVEINGIQTGATLSADTHLYLKVAKKAYDKAVAKLNS